MRDPNAYFAEVGIEPPKIAMGGLDRVIMEAIPETKGQQPLLEQVWRDLENAGLHKSGPLTTGMTGTGLFQKRTTDIADEFLDFISDPLAASGDGD